MTQTQIIEIVKMHHPEMGDTEIRIYLNKALDEFCEHTRILQGQQTFTTTASTRYYKLDDIVYMLPLTQFHAWFFQA